MASFSKIAKGVLAWPGWIPIGLLSGAAKPLHLMVQWGGDVDFIAEYWGGFIGFLDTGWGTFGAVVGATMFGVSLGYRITRQSKPSDSSKLINPSPPQNSDLLLIERQSESAAPSKKEIYRSVADKENLGSVRHEIIKELNGTAKDFSKKVGELIEIGQGHPDEYERLSSIHADLEQLSGKLTSFFHHPETGLFKRYLPNAAEIGEVINDNVGLHSAGVLAELRTYWVLYFCCVQIQINGGNKTHGAMQTITEHILKELKTSKDNYDEWVRATIQRCEGLR